jgi:hypothetical protein
MIRIFDDRMWQLFLGAFIALSLLSDFQPRLGATPKLTGDRL